MNRESIGKFAIYINRYFFVSVFVSILVMLCCAVPCSASGNVDFRVAGSITDTSRFAEYVLHVHDCTDLVSLRITAGDYSNVISISSNEMTVPNDYPLSREYSFTGSGTGYLQPSVTLTDKFGETTTHSEIFAADKVFPSISISNIAMHVEDEQQVLLVSFDASDDVDIVEVGAEISGVYGHKLVAAGGVVDKALADAFALSDGYIVQIPFEEEQNLFHIKVPLLKQLSSDEIAHDGIVFIDAYSTDSSGHRTKISETKFTGKDVSDTASLLQVVSPASKDIQFSNPLESRSIIPSVTYQFRGLTPLPGAGTGVVYNLKIAIGM